MNNDLKYIIVDDDPFNNMICTMNIEDALGDVDIKSFTHPEEGLLSIQNNHIISPTILFLDLNMPTLPAGNFWRSTRILLIR